jgi:hypothetical protein
MYVCVVGAVAVVAVVVSLSATSVPGRLAEDVFRPPSFMVVNVELSVECVHKNWR